MAADHRKIDLVFRIVPRAVLSGAATFFVLLGYPLFSGEVFEEPPRPPIGEAVARARLNEETTVATELGLALDRTVPLGDEPWRAELDVVAGECVALIAIAWGPERVESVVAVPSGSVVGPRATDAVLASGYVEGLVAHAQGCAEHAETWTVGVSRVSRAGSVGPRRGELRILRAPLERIGSSARLNRGWVRVTRARDGGPPPIDASPDGSAGDGSTARLPGARADGVGPSGALPSSPGEE